MEYISKVMLCGRPNACCPEARLTYDGTIEIEDDDGNCIYMTKEQFEVLKRTNF